MIKTQEHARSKTRFNTHDQKPGSIPMCMLLGFDRGYKNIFKCKILHTFIVLFISFSFYLSCHIQQLCVNVLGSSHKIRRYLMMCMVICKEAVAVLALSLCFI